MRKNSGFTELTVAIGLVIVLSGIAFSQGIFTLLKVQENKNLLSREKDFYSGEVGSITSYVKNNCDALAPSGHFPLAVQPEVVSSTTLSDTSGSVALGTPMDPALTRIHAPVTDLLTSLGQTQFNYTFGMKDGLNQYCGEVKRIRGGKTKTTCIRGISPPALAARDTSFNGTGVVRASVGTSSSTSAKAVFELNDGKLLVLGSKTYFAPIAAPPFSELRTRVAVVRLLANGTVDTTYAAAGFRELACSTNFCAINGTTIDVLGRVTATGPSLAGNFVARFASDGNLDATFGSGGISYVPTHADEGTNIGIFVQADGKILTLATARMGVPPTATTNATMIRRLTVTGALDPSFGASGTAIFGFSPYLDVAFNLAIQSDGKLLVAGGTYQEPLLISAPFGQNAVDFLLFRLMPNGTLDPSFGLGGKVTTRLSRWNSAQGILVQPDGKILLGGTIASTVAPEVPLTMAVLRYLADGTPDPTFGDSGARLMRFNCSQTASANVIRLVGSRIDVVGLVGNGTQNSVAFLRLDAAGNPDTTYGNHNGKKTAPFLSPNSLIRSVGTDTAGRVILTGIDPTSLALGLDVVRLIP